MIPDARRPPRSSGRHCLAAPGPQALPYRRGRSRVLRPGLAEMGRPPVGADQHAGKEDCAARRLRRRRLRQNRAGGEERPERGDHRDARPHASHRSAPCGIGRVLERFTWPSAKLDSMEATPPSRVSLSFRKRS